MFDDIHSTKIILKNNAKDKFLNCFIRYFLYFKSYKNVAASQSKCKKHID